MKCGPLEVDEERRLCVCPNGGTFRDGLCYSDGSVVPLDGMVVGDAGPPTEDAQVEAPDACATRTYYRDADGDGFGDRTQSMDACERPDGYVEDDADCDDACETCTPEGTEVCDAETRDEDCDGTPNAGCACTSGSAPIACGTTDEGACQRGEQRCVDGAYGACEGAIEPVAETCNEIDDDCDGRTDETVRTTFYRDADGDGRGTSANTVEACAAPTGYVASSDDCNDGCATCLPGRAETCDGLNNDCDATTDEGVQTTFYRDADGDGRGNATMSMQACAAPSGYVASSSDCNDSCNTCYPGRAEVCDGLNNDCDAATDEGVLSTFYRDMDGDSYGSASMPTSACAAPAGYVANDDDCNDSCMTCRPGGTETCDGQNNDCDAATDEGVLSTFYRDADGDSYGTAAMATQACSAPSGYVARSGDCSDSCAVCFPGNAEVCDGLDNNCAGGPDEGVLTTYYADCDGDGYAASGAISSQACATPSVGPSTCTTGGWTTRAPGTQPDCVDTNRSAFPGQTLYFSTPIAGVPASRDYDYDCDNFESLSETQTGVTSCGSGTSSQCRGRSGWTGNTVPACGVGAEYRSCLTPIMGSTCASIVFASYAQPCR